MLIGRKTELNELLNVEKGAKLYGDVETAVRHSLFFK